MHRQIAGLALLSGTFLVLLGCGSRVTRVAVFPAGGTVVSAGRPAAKAIILFHPVSPKTNPAGGPGVDAIATETDSEGKYRLSTYEADDGAPAGDYVVTVRPGGAPEIEGGDGLARRTAPSASLAKYAEPATSLFKATIKPGENRFDFELR